MNQSRLNEIVRIVRDSDDLKSFYEGFLATAAQMSNAQVGVAWDCTSEPYRPICQVQAKSGSAAKLTISEHKHRQLLTHASRNHRCFMVEPSSETGTQSDDPVILFGPIKRDSSIELVEFILPANSERETRREVLRELDEYCKLASQFQADQPVTSSKSFQPLPPDVVGEYAHLVHDSLDPQVVANTLANEARRVLDCDRVSVVMKKRGKFKLAAISGQPSINQRSNTVQLLSRLAHRVLPTGKAFWYPAAEAVPPQIEQPLEEYLGFSATRSLAILPVFDRETNVDDDHSVRLDVIAGIIIEQCHETWEQTLVVQPVETVRRHGSSALRNALRHKQLFGYSLWNWLGSSVIVNQVRNLPRALAIIGVLALASLALLFWPASFDLHSDGVLLPSHRRNVFAQVEGVVAEIHVDHGDAVEEGTPLLSMKNMDLEMEVADAAGNVDALKSQLEINQLRRMENQSEQDGLQVKAQKKALEAQLELYQRRQAVVRAETGKLQVSSPIQGEVITWELKNRLQQRPVVAGEVLLEVADPNGPWELELQLPDRRVGHLLRYVDELKEQNQKVRIPVTYQLAASPGTQFKGIIREIEKSTQLIANEQSVRLTVEVNEEEIEAIRQAGSGVSAKIHCGEKPLGYVLFHDLYEFVQSQIVFRIW